MTQYVARKVRPALVFASPGGHLSEALLLTDRIENKVIVTYSHTERLGELPRVAGVLRAFPVRISVLGHFVNVFLFLCYFLRYRPRAVLSTGGPFCLPAFALAKLFGTKSFYIDTLARPDGGSNTFRFLVKWRLARHVLTQWPHMADPAAGVEFHGSIISLRDGRNDELSIRSPV